jgi:hypothetical protein
MTANHPFMIPSREALQYFFHKYYVFGKFPSRNVGNRRVSLAEHEGLVINRLQSDDVKFPSSVLQALKHENIEEILNFQEDGTFNYFVTPMFVDVLENVWAEKTQFSKYSVSKMFIDFLNGLEYLRNFWDRTAFGGLLVHGCIHERNMAFNGKNWYISGLITTMKTEECMSYAGYGTNDVLKSRRYFIASDKDRKAPLKNGDDLWQLVLMYVRTYYGIEPFESTSFARVVDVIEGKCNHIAASGKDEKDFGKTLREMLVSTEELKCYSKVRGIFENNTDEHC